MHAHRNIAEYVNMYGQHNSTVVVITVGTELALILSLHTQALLRKKRSTITIKFKIYFTGKKVILSLIAMTVA